MPQPKPTSLGIELPKEIARVRERHPPMAKAKLTEAERHVMRHALGLNQAGYIYRNFYRVGRADDPVWNGLVEKGFGERTTNPRRDCFCVTPAGRAALAEAEKEREAKP